MARAAGASASFAFVRVRTVLFWAHLAGGCTAGLVILLMAVTGALLTYERQIMAGFEWAARGDVPHGATRRSADELLAAVTSPEFTPEAVMLRADPAAPVRVSASRRQRMELDPFSGEAVPPAAPRADAFFDTVMGLHRWFALEGDARDGARAVTGAANLVFLGLAVTGFVLWWPRRATRQAWRLRLTSQEHYPTTKARDYAYHHVLGFRFLIPILAIAATAPVFNYDWAQDLLKRIAGEGPGERADPVPWSGSEAGAAAWLESAREASGDWNTLLLALPEGDAGTVSVTVDRGNGAQIQHQEVMVLARDTAEVISRAPRYAEDPYRYSRMVVRFLHTGEIFGWLGQTVAGLASLMAAVLVWTGLSLALRRLLLKPWRQRQARMARGVSAGEPSGG